MTGARLLDHPVALCNIARRAAIEAGNILLDHFEGVVDGGETADPAQSPAAQACRAAGVLIRGALERATPDVPVIDAGPDGMAAVGAGFLPHEAPAFWLVDPLDGRDEFMGGGTDFTVNIALVKNAIPVVGVVYAPFAQELYAGSGPGTALRWLADSGQDKPISVRPWPKAGLIVMTARFPREPEQLDRFLEDYKVARVIRRGSSLKICAVAAGRADLYPCLTATHWCETAAGDAVLRSAGGALRAIQTGEKLRYDPAAIQPGNPAFIATSEAWAGGLPASANCPPESSRPTDSDERDPMRR